MDLFGVAAIIVAVGGFIKIWYDVRAVHTIVNSQRTDMLNEIEALKRMLAQSIIRERHEGVGVTDKTTRPDQQQG